MISKFASKDTASSADLEGKEPSKRVLEDKGQIPAEVDGTVFDFVKDTKKALQDIDKQVEKLLVDHKKLLNKNT